MTDKERIEWLILNSVIISRGRESIELVIPNSSVLWERGQSDKVFLRNVREAIDAVMKYKQKCRTMS